MLEKFDLIDNRLIAILKTGPHFTKQTAYGDRFDQSRIDRGYVSDRGHWLEYVREVVHDTTQ